VPFHAAAAVRKALYELFDSLSVSPYRTPELSMKRRTCGGLAPSLMCPAAYRHALAAATASASKASDSSILPHSSWMVTPFLLATKPHPMKYGGLDVELSVKLFQPHFFAR